MKSNAEVKEVHVIFKTHLDLGFTDLAANVVRKYVDEFIPDALRLAEQSRQEDPSRRFVWTTGSWLVHQFLEKADKRGRDAMERAIPIGDFAWHALPFTTHTELMDASLFRFGLSLSQELDARFGCKTIGAKMTDVPGHTRSMIPVLAETGVEFLHIGVNPACPPPKTPPLFRWQEPAGAELIVMVQHDYGDVMILPDGETAVAVSFTGDNQGPISVNEVRVVYDRLTSKFPNARIHASTLSSVARSLIQLRSLLPVVTSEIGDTWIHGVGTDPTKVRRFRELSRLRQEWLSTGAMAIGERSHPSFSLPLLAVAEHTWGMDEKTHLGDFEAYEPKAFAELRREERCRRFEASWKEQRAYIDGAIAALGHSDLADQAIERLRETEPSAPDLDGFSEVTDPSARFETQHLTLGFGGDGSIAFLRENASGRIWADQDHRFGLLSYQTFSADDYVRYFRQYATHQPDWALKDLTKPGMESAVLHSGSWQPVLTRLLRHENGTDFICEISMPAESPHGCPRRMMLRVELETRAPELNLDVQWFDKPASRLPEAVWMSMVPRGVRADGWTLDKMGRAISPLDVAPKGNRKLHAVNRFIRYRDPKDEFLVETIDAPLVAPGEPSLLDFNGRRPPLRKGIHFNLYNNVWGTNFPMWCSDDARFRFRLIFGSRVSKEWDAAVGGRSGNPGVL